jgi:hypothetical protein
VLLEDEGLLVGLGEELLAKAVPVAMRRLEELEEPLVALERTRHLDHGGQGGAGAHGSILAAAGLMAIKGAAIRGARMVPMIQGERK